MTGCNSRWKPNRVQVFIFKKMIAGEKRTKQEQKVWDILCIKNG
tara:strand:- start:481 stop:612 length:132 start_codon:yes stop_codon:yes gene_type:complete